MERMIPAKAIPPANIFNKKVNVVRSFFILLNPLPLLLQDTIDYIPEFFHKTGKGIKMVSGYHVLNGKHWQIRIDFFLG